MEKHRGCAPNAPGLASLTRPGAPEEELPRGFHARSASRRVSGGDFDAAAAAVLSWGSLDDEHDAATSFVARGPDGSLATVARTYGRLAWVVNPVRQTYAEAAATPPAADPDWRRLPRGTTFAAAAYTTLGRHLLAGEERLAVVRDGRDVVVHVLSASRGHGLAGRLVFPFVGPMQRRFFEAQLDVVERACRPER